MTKKEYNGWTNYETCHDEIEFKLQTLDGKTFKVLQDGFPVVRGSFEQVAKAVGFYPL